jgi:hypothetical protein
MHKPNTLRQPKFSLNLEKTMHDISLDAFEYENEHLQDTVSMC